MNALSPIDNAQNKGPDNAFRDQLRALSARANSGRAEDVLEIALETFGDRFAIVSSFGAESAVLLHMAAAIDPGIAVLFLDTGKLFGETKRYRDRLIADFGLTGVRSLHPDADSVSLEDPKGHLWQDNSNACCFLRKVQPLHAALDGFDAWATGRKRFQTLSRGAIEPFELSDGKIKVNPLATWTKTDVDAYKAKHGLPDHPLVAEGFLSIGCMPCTDRVADGEDERAGRWRGSSKAECGIHLSLKDNLSLLGKNQDD